MYVEAIREDSAGPGPGQARDDDDDDDDRTHAGVVPQLLFEQRPADVGGIMQLPGPIVVEDLSEDARVTVEKVLVEYRLLVK